MTKDKDKDLLKDIDDSRLESSLLAYLGLISSIAMLDPGEVEKRIAITRNPRLSDEERQEARESLILANTRLVVNIAKQYYHTGIHLMDLISEGTIGLMAAVEKFDPTKGFRLSTYATWWIRQRILRYIINNQYLIRVPEHVIDKISRLNKAAAAYRSAHKKEPALEDLSKATGLAPEDVERYAGSLPNILSLEESFESTHGEDSGAPGLHEKVGSGEDIIQHVLDRATVQQMLQLLDKKEQMVVRRRYGLTLDEGSSALRSNECSTLEELARELGVSRERVRQIERIALNKIKRRFYGEK
jgi:RNA polymerase primary sigma factor